MVRGGAERARSARVVGIALVAVAALALAGGCADESDESRDTAPDVDAGVDIGGADGVGGGDVPDDPDTTPTDTCVDDRAFFEDDLWPNLLLQVCSSCHVNEGLARTSNLVFANSARPDYLDVNRERLSEVARLERDGVSLVLLKPLGELNHGGGVVIAEDSESYALLEEFVSRIRTPVVCDSEVATPRFDGVTLASPEETLRKASLLLVGRLPTAQEVEDVRFGGELALSRAVDAMMREEAFYDRVRELFNDVFLTDRYLGNQRATSLLSEARFPYRYWYESEANDTRRNRYRDRTNTAIARQGIELIVHIVRHDRPFSEVLTADYMMVNQYSAVSFGLTDTWPELGDPEGEFFYEARIADAYHAGILTTPAFLNRYPTTPTNRNRHRSRVFFDRFLATDILTLADRPIDPTISDYHNATLNDPQCTVCHASLDPVAGLFQNWDTGGMYRPPEEGWFPEMAVPGFGDTILPVAQRSSALSWLGSNVVDDPRFALATIHNLYRALIGTEPLAVIELDGNADMVAREAFRSQRAVFNDIIDQFSESDQNVKVIIRELVLSPYFRAVHASDDAASHDVLAVGLARLLTPEELSRKILAVMGYGWRHRNNQDDFFRSTFRLLYGGIDSDGTVHRLREPNGLTVNIADRMAYDMACRFGPRDFALRADARRLFPYVEPSFVPQTPEGFPVPDAVEAIRMNIQHLHERVLGESLELDDPEIDATYELFFDLWIEGRDAVAAEEISNDLPSSCRAESDFWTGESFPSDRRIRRDQNYTIRAWLGVLAYMLSDYRFIYE